MANKTRCGNPCCGKMFGLKRYGNSFGKQFCSQSCMNEYTVQKHTSPLPWRPFSWLRRLVAGAPTKTAPDVRA